MTNAKRGVKVLSVGWLGVRTTRSAAMSAFYRDVLGLQVLHRDASSSRFRLNDGTEAHVYTENDSDHVFFGSAPVMLAGLRDGRSQMPTFSGPASTTASGRLIVSREPGRLVALPRVCPSSVPPSVSYAVLLASAEAERERVL
jgi:hypothetical protein